jgi:putative hydrolase of HD superfamily
MSMPSANHDRVTALIQLSDRVYPAIDRRVGDEARAHRIVRLGITTVAQTLETSYSHRLPGDQYHALLVHQLVEGDLHASGDAYAAWPTYQKSLTELPRIPLIQPKSELTSLSCRYSDVARSTIARDGNYESDASHAVHLSALALPYAAELYPELDQAKIALYCLLHDIVEAYTGDIATLGASDEVMRMKQVAEEKGLMQFADEFGVPYPHFVDLVHDYEHLTDNEAKFVKAFDKLDPSFTHLSNNGLSLTRDYGIRTATEFLRQTDSTTDRMRSYAADFPEVMADRQELLLQVANNAAWPK